MPAKPKDVITVRHCAAITRTHRAALNGHRSFVVWFTGLSGSGKSTIAHTVEERLHYLGHNSFVLDGDNVRSGLCSDLGFSPEDRHENIRRIGEVAKLLIEAGVIVLIALISPFRAHRRQVRDLVGDQDFIEIFCRCPIAVCEQRDVKGLYGRARQGEIKEYTGISSPYEEPLQPELTLETAACSIEACVDQVMGLLEQRGLLSSRLNEPRYKSYGSSQ
jgi:adenylylsulfate kinase